MVSALSETSKTCDERPWIESLRLLQQHHMQQQALAHQQQMELMLLGLDTGLQWLAMACNGLQWLAMACNGLQWLGHGLAMACNGLQWLAMFLLPGWWAQKHAKSMNTSAKTMDVCGPSRHIKRPILLPGLRCQQLSTTMAPGTIPSNCSLAICCF